MGPFPRKTVVNERFIRIPYWKCKVLLVGPRLPSWEAFPVPSQSSLPRGKATCSNPWRIHVIMVYLISTYTNLPQKSPKINVGKYTKLVPWIPKRDTLSPKIPWQKPPWQKGLKVEGSTVEFPTTDNQVVGKNSGVKTNIAGWLAELPDSYWVLLLTEKKLKPLLTGALLAVSLREGFFWGTIFRSHDDLHPIMKQRLGSWNLK